MSNLERPAHRFTNESSLFENLYFRQANASHRLFRLAADHKLVVSSFRDP